MPSRRLPRCGLARTKTSPAEKYRFACDPLDRSLRGRTERSGRPTGGADGLHASFGRPLLVRRDHPATRRAESSRERTPGRCIRPHDLLLLDDRGLPAAPVSLARRHFSNEALPGHYHLGLPGIALPSLRCFGPAVVPDSRLLVSASVLGLGRPRRRGVDGSASLAAPV